jgi:hypothetical protein
MIIGVSGEAGHGKNTVADMIAEMYSAQFVITGSKIVKTDFHDKFEQRAFADPLKRVCSALTGYPIEVFYDRSKKDKVIPLFNITVRELMQGLNILKTINKKVFIFPTMLRVKPNQNILFTDVRYYVEKESIEEMDGITLRVVRWNEDGSRYVDASLDTEEKRNHSSETELRGATFSHVIHNTEGLEQLKEQVREFMIKFKLLK